MTLIFPSSLEPLSSNGLPHYLCFTQKLLNLFLIMAFSVVASPVPLETTSNGVVRVGGTRVTLDTVVATFLDGATAEEIAQQYPSLHLADVYAVISYYLRHIEEVEAYLSERRKQAAEVRRENEARFDPSGVRERLLARQQ